MSERKNLVVNVEKVRITVGGSCNTKMFKELTHNLYERCCPLIEKKTPS